MKVYRVNFDANHYQSVYPEDESLWQGGALTFNGTSRLDGWCPPRLFCLKPMLKRGDFFAGISGVLIASPQAMATRVKNFFSMAGELLPVIVEGEPEPFTLLNVTECINVLDRSRTQWTKDPKTGQNLSITKYVFHPNRFVESTLFKIPETSRGNIYVVERCSHPEDEFKAYVEHFGLKGLVFEEMWEQ